MYFKKGTYQKAKTYPNLQKNWFVIITETQSKGQVLVAARPEPEMPAERVHL